MNKGITLIILLVVFTAMGLVMFSHIGGKERPAQPQDPATTPQPAPSQNGYANPLQAPQGDAGNLRSFEPPLSNGRSAIQMTPGGTEGMPQPVRLTSGSDEKSPQPVVFAPGQSPEAGAGSSAQLSGGKSAVPSADVSGTAQAPSSMTLPVSQNTVADAPRSGQASEAKPQPTPTPPVEKPTSGSPGLTPWKTPPQEKPSSSAKPAAQASARQTPGQAQSRTQERAPAQKETQAQPSSNKRGLRAIALVSADKGMQLQIEADGPFPCNAFILTGPDRLVVDLPGSWTGMRKPDTPQNTLIKNVRLGQQPTGPRLVLDLAGPLKGHKVERSGSTTRIIMQ